MSSSKFELPGPLVLVGAGNMGGALLKGWLAGGMAPSQVVVQDPAPPQWMQVLMAEAGIASVANLPAGTPKAGVLLLAVKPQILDQVAPTVADAVGPSTVVLSVAAGKTIAGIARHYRAGTAIVRTIPNTPASVGRGITVATANGDVTASQRALCESLLSVVGEVGWVDDERLIDAATAVSGSGPAYVFHLAEALAAAARSVGLPPDLADRLARITVTGAGELLHQSDLDPGQLRKNVTSPNGTTAAALAVLMAEPGGLTDLMTRAVAAAENRSRELAM